MDRARVATTLVVPVLTILVGGGVPIDTSMGVQMGKAMGHGVRAAFLSYIMICTCLLPIILVGRWTALKQDPLDRPQVKQNRPNFQWWYLMGGIFTAASQTTAILVVPLIGNSLFFVSLVTGQLVSSLVIDHFGILVQPARLTLNKGVGVTIVFIGCILQQDFDSDASAVQAALLSLISLTSGFCLPAQSVINRRFALYLGSKLNALAVTFAVGMVVLLTCSLISLISSPWTLHHTEIWYWFEFALVLGYISSSFIFPIFIGMGPYFVLILAGKISMSLIADNFGLFASEVVKASPRRIAGCALAVFGAAVFQIVWVRPSPDDNSGQSEGQDQASLFPSQLDEKLCDSRAVMQSNNK